MKEIKLRYLLHAGNPKIIEKAFMFAKPKQTKVVFLDSHDMYLFNNNHSLCLIIQDNYTTKAVMKLKGTEEYCLNIAHLDLIKIMKTPTSIFKIFEISGKFLLDDVKIIAELLVKKKTRYGVHAACTLTKMECLNLKPMYILDTSYSKKETKDNVDKFLTKSSIGFEYCNKSNYQILVEKIGVKTV